MKKTKLIALLWVMSLLLSARYGAVMAIEQKMCNPVDVPHFQLSDIYIGDGVLAAKRSPLNRIHLGASTPRKSLKWGKSLALRRNKRERESET